MREIKFRAWDKTGKQMRQVVDIHLVRNEAYIDTIYENLWRTIGEQVELMQFTNIYDDDGKEIYEGDIVSVHSEGDLDHEAVLVENMGFEHNYATSASFRVLGNQYENPEMVELCENLVENILRNRSNE